MKINYLKINGFGKLKNKAINLNENINLIYGKNESGKSTLLKFISSMFYGVTKTKNGKVISDLEKYKPWVNDEFSGKIRYKLDDNSEYEVFRDFSKKNPKIYNSNLEDISDKFKIDKTKGSQFFYDQTKIDEDLFFSTNIVEQQEVVLDNNDQNLLTQKIANILSTGDDNISYKKVNSNLSKKLLEEVGTDRSTGRPINEINDEINKLKIEKNELNNIENINNEIKENKKEIEEELNNIKNEINILKEIKLIKEEEQKELEKININENIKNEYNEKIINLKNNINNNINNNQENKNDNNGRRYKNNEENKLNKNNLINIIVISILVILNILINCINLPHIINILIIVSTIIYLIGYFVSYLLNKNKYKINNNKNNNINNVEKEEKIKLEKELELLEENILNKEKEINNIKEEINEKYNSNLNILKNKYIDILNSEEIINIFNSSLNDINNDLELLNNKYNSKNIELNTLSIKQIDINNKIENKIEVEERLEYLEEQKEELKYLEETINIAKDALEEAYAKMRSEITPEFTKDLSILIEKISNGKYKKASFDSEYGLRVEGENGEYIDTLRLSVGTIDQLYLSLRLSSMNEISKEKMPIILDESFAYYDNERLENILKFINENYLDNQILIFTCSNREKDIMDKLNIKYNYIEM